MKRKPRAIIFDDDDSIRSMLTRFFVMRGYDCLSFDDPTSFCPVDGGGGESCRNCNAGSDILITDINMPGMNGLDLLEIQQRQGCHLDIRKKAVMSGDLEEPGRKQLQSLGCSFFKKPFTLNALSEWLAECEQRPDLNLPFSEVSREEQVER